ncbi:unnamed protein product [Orchesella dallaii]|uniref:Uncharacterized protein n=1 Tax=Orchesella dallaii TaxID=48710 RepID=A0ABP1RJP2_9HEXA
MCRRCGAVKRDSVGGWRRRFGGKGNVRCLGGLWSISRNSDASILEVLDNTFPVSFWSLLLDVEEDLLHAKLLLVSAHQAGSGEGGTDTGLQPSSDGVTRGLV